MILREFIERDIHHLGVAELYEVAFIPGLMVVDASGVVTYRRRSTSLPAGQTVSEQWDAEVRAALDAIVE